MKRCQEKLLIINYSTPTAKPQQYWKCSNKFISFHFNKSQDFNFKNNLVRKWMQTSPKNSKDEIWRERSTEQTAWFVLFSLPNICSPYSFLVFPNFAQFSFFAQFSVSLQPERVLPFLSRRFPLAVAETPWLAGSATPLPLRTTTVDLSPTESL